MNSHRSGQAEKLSTNSGLLWWVLGALMLLVFGLPSLKPLFALLFPDLPRHVYEQDSFASLLWAHLEIVGLSSAVAVIVGVTAAVFATRPSGREFRPLIETLVSMGQTFPPVAVLAVAVRWYTGRASQARGQAPRPLLTRKWMLGAVLLALLATANLLIAGQPWGVVYGFCLWAAKLAQATGAADLAGNWFWSQGGNAARLQETVLMDVTSITNIGILGGALWVSAGKAATAKPLTGTQWAVALVAGLALGYSSRLAFGCNVGAMFSGMSTGSIHGWIWVPLAFAGTIFGLRIRRRFGF